MRNYFYKYSLLQKCLNTALWSGFSLHIFFIIAGGAFFLSCSSTATGYKTISVEESKIFLAQTPNAVIVDVRTPSEFTSETGHLSKAVLLPVQELEQRIGELSAYKKQPILVYCRSGSRSKTASSILSAQGFSILNMDGGITAWKAAGYPVER